MKLKGYHLPARFPPDREYEHSAGPIAFHLAEMTPPRLIELMDFLRRSQRAYLANQKIEDLLSVCHQAVTQWLNPSYRIRRIAEDALHHITGYSRPMINKGLTHTFQNLRRNHLRSILKEELGHPLFLDQFRPRSTGTSKAFGPALTSHYLAANIPGLPVQELIRTLLVKSGGLFKVSSEEPLLLNLFCQSLVRIRPRLGDCFAILSWKGGSPKTTSLDRAAILYSDVVLATGDDDTIERIETQVGTAKGVRLIPYGPRFSIGLVGRESLKAVVSIARKAAIDVSIYDQMGCLSPHAFYVETEGKNAPQDFARALAGQLDRLQNSLPPRRADMDSAASIQQLRHLYRMKRAEGQNIELYEGKKGSFWTVIFEPRPGFHLSPLGRTIRVYPVKQLEEIPAILAPWRHYLQAAGIAVSDNRIIGLSNVLASLGVSRICAIGDMQTPPYNWHRDGRPMFSDLIHWVDVE